MKAHVNMKMGVVQMYVCCLFLILSRWSPSLGEDTVAEDIGVHQIERLVELLSLKECEDLLLTLSHPEESIFQHLERLSPEKNRLNIKKRVKRDTIANVDNVDSEAECQRSLSDWLQRYGAQVYYDRLSRALQHIGRTDIAMEVGKNINQDKSLKIKRYVEGYHNYVSSLNIPSGAEHQQTADSTKRKKRKVRDLTWQELDLVIERPPALLYQKGPLDGALTLLYGLLVGFGSALLVAVSIVLLIARLSCQTPQQRSERSTSAG